VSPKSPCAADGGSVRSIVDAATELFAEEGFEPVSVARIAARAGVCKANVFHHFNSKDQLVLAVMQQVSSEHAELAERLLAEDGAVAGKLRRLLRADLELMLANEARTRLLLRECQDRGHPRARALAQQVFRRNFDAIVALFEQGRARGEFRADLDPAAVTLLTMAMTNFFMEHREALEHWPSTAGLADPEAWVESICTIVLGGILAPQLPRARGSAHRRSRKVGA
jgi:TetR/AcrR family transcriptional regulator